VGDCIGDYDVAIGISNTIWKSLTSVGNPNYLIDPNNQNEALQFHPCNDFRENAVYEGTLDMSKDGKTSNMVGMVIARHSNSIFLNLSEYKEPTPGTN
jgi:hypothetical protein